MGALIPLVLSIAPEAARWLFGGDAARTAASVSRAVEDATGTADPSAAEAALERDPETAARLRAQLAQVGADAERAARAAEMEALAARLRDTADARGQTVALASQHSPIAWGAPMVSIVVLATFGVVMALALTRTLPDGSEAILNMLLGSLAAMATSVVSYWVGSSAGSARKEAQLSQLRSGSPS